MQTALKHKETGKLLGALIWFFLLVLRIILEIQKPSPDWENDLLIFSLLIVFVSGFLASLKVVIEDGRLNISIARGLIRRSILLANVTSCRIVKLPWYHLWGLREIPNGRMYNITGFVCLELILFNREVIQIGTEYAVELAEALVDATGIEFDSSPSNQ